MARTINAEHVRRSDMFLVPPDQIIVDHSQNTRLYKPKIDDLVQGFKASGQLQPCIVRPLPEGMIQLVFGYRRWLAAMAIAKEQREANIEYESRFKLACVVQKLGPDDALIANISENAERENLSPIEEAVAIKRLRDLKGWVGPDGNERIAAVFKRSPSWVIKREELLKLSEAHRFAVHQYFTTHGEEGFSLTVAEIIKDAPEEKRDKILQEAAKAKDAIAEGNTPTGKSKSSTARLKVRDIASAAATNGVAVTKGRDIKDLYAFIDGYFDGSEVLHPLHPVTTEFLKRLRGYMRREFDDAQLDATLIKIDRCLAEHYIDTKQRRAATR